VAFAREWRAKITPEFERLLVNTDPHSPHQFRVRGAIANVPEFARAFACRSESTAAGAGEPAAIW
jgi:putative endopeptidase